MLTIVLDHRRRDPSISVNPSAVNGLLMKNRAPAAVAASCMSVVHSDVTKPNGTAWPAERSAWRTSTPVMPGMFQSEMIRSGYSAMYLS